MTAARFQHPFQCIRYVEKRLGGFQNLLLASAGPKIYSYAAESGQRLSDWPRDLEHKCENSPKEATGADLSSESQGPPEKKRKVTPSGDNDAGDYNVRQTSGDTQIPIAWSNIPLLLSTSNAKHLVAVTAEDKCIRVLEVGEDGILQHLSARHMPKRPSSIALASNDSIILCGDKFGDVYALPLIPSEEKNIPQSQTPSNPKLSQPAATNLTVHTKRNLLALEQQKKHPSKALEEKQALGFEHRLLLGHVSMLTDVALASLPTDTSAHGTHQFILSADRDEHIRVSRGPSQAHIIENYCLGHTSFVVKLCIPRFAPEILISGGGDDYLLVWKWIECRVLQKVPLLDQKHDSTEVTVRGIWAVSFTDSENTSSTTNLVLVALEGSPRLLFYLLQSDGTLNPQGSIQLSGNALDVTSDEAQGTILVSVDCVRESGSTQAWRTDIGSPQTLIEGFRAKLGTETLEWGAVEDSMIANVNSTGTVGVPLNIEERQQKELNESLYSLGKLRKTVATDNE